jgi:hypothetical protein
MLAFAVGLAACSIQTPPSRQGSSTDRDSRAQIPPTFDRRLVGSWSCRGYDWSAGHYVLTFRSNAKGLETRREGANTIASPFMFGTFGDSLYRYTHGSMPSDETYSIRGRTLTVGGNMYWKEGDGWIAVPEVSKGVCRRM